MRSTAAQGETGMSSGMWALSILSGFVCLASWTSLMAPEEKEGWSETSRVTECGVH